MPCRQLRPGLSYDNVLLTVISYQRLLFESSHDNRYSGYMFALSRLFSQSRVRQRSSDIILL